MTYTAFGAFHLTWEAGNVRASMFIAVAVAIHLYGTHLMRVLPLMLSSLHLVVAVGVLVVGLEAPPETFRWFICFWIRALVSIVFDSFRVLVAHFHKITTAQVWHANISKQRYVITENQNKINLANQGVGCGGVA